MTIYYADSEAIKKLKSGVKFENPIHLDWPGLFDYLEVGDLFSDFPSCNTLVKQLSTHLPNGMSDDTLIHIYDKMFTETLSHVKALPQIHPDFLLKKIDETPILTNFHDALQQIKKRLKEDSYNVVHDLVLYLGWDRVCIYLAVLFESIPSGKGSLPGLYTLQHCLIESFQHITSQRRSEPSFFRLIEALYAFEMREDKLETHSEEEWQILCKATSLLKDRSSLPNVPIINQAFKKEVVTIGTHTWKSAKALATLMNNKIKSFYPEWIFKIDNIKSDII